MVPSKTGNTTNLFNHLKKYHPSDYTESVKMRAESGQLVSLSQSRLSTSAAASSGPAGTGGAAAQPKQQSIISSFSAVAPYEQNSKRSKTITKAITFCIAKDMMPLNTVEKEGFKHLIKVLDQRYEIPGRKYFSQTALPQLYDECREKLEMDLKDVSFFATTTDLWSSRSSEPYLSLTIHYIDKEWTLQSTCLQTAYFPEDHTAEIISRGLEDALESWNLSKDRQVCITTDNGANIVKAVALQGWTRLQCFGHRLHSAIGGSMKDERIVRAVGVSKKLVSAFSYSWKKKKALAAAQDELKLPKHKLITESPTRWGSRHAMIARILEQEKAIAKVLSDDRKNRHLIPSWQDIDVLESVHKALNPLVDFTDALSGEAYVSVSCVKPVLQLFNEEVLKPDDTDTELTKAIKNSVTCYLNEKYDDDVTDDLLSMATLVDPRFKTNYIQADKKEALKINAVSQMFDEWKTSQSRPTTSAEATSSAAPVKVTKKTIGSVFKKSFAASTSGQTDEQAVEAELNSYLQVPNADSETNPLVWWKIHSTTYPRVSLLAKRYLCIPATSSPSERAFSTGGNIVSCHRAALKPDAVNRLVFLAKNLSPSPK
nr:E3 SUMO-protein ligase ZBED1-like [Nothobranchius furzeri]